MLLINKRIGLWSFTLSAREAATAIAVRRAREDGRAVAADLAALYAAMLAKQRHLAARFPRRRLARPRVWRMYCEGPPRAPERGSVQTEPSPNPRPAPARS